MNLEARPNAKRARKELNRPTKTEKDKNNGQKEMLSGSAQGQKKSPAGFWKIRRRRAPFGEAEPSLSEKTAIEPSGALLVFPLANETISFVSTANFRRKPEQLRGYYLFRMATIQKCLLFVTNCSNLLSS